MKDTINKDKRRRIEINDKINYYEAWEISYKYSNKLIQKIDHNNLYILCYITYENYMNELKHKKLNIKNKKYTQIWDTMINTVKIEKNMKKAVYLLHQTNIQRLN